MSGDGHLFFFGMLFMILSVIFAVTYYKIKYNRNLAILKDEREQCNVNIDV